MEFQPINEIPVADYCPGADYSDTAEKRRQALNLKIRKLLSARAEFADDHARLQAIPVDKFSVTDLDKAGELKARRLTLLKAEAAIRVELDEQWYPLRGEERARVRNAAASRVMAITDDVRKRLAGIGYQTEDGDPLRVTPQFFQLHPQVREARADCDSAVEVAQSQDDVHANREALEYVNDQLGEIVRNAMALA